MGMGYRACSEGLETLAGPRRPEPLPRLRGPRPERLQAREKKQTSLLATLSCGCVFPFASSSSRRSSLFPTSWSLETLTSQLIFSHLPLEQGCWPCAFPRPVPVPGGSVGPEVTSEREGAHTRP